jgi:alpha-tubulin suppressor-like RCC1 family protein
VSEEHQLEKEIRDKRAFVWCFGKNSNGELGVQSTKDVLMPRSIMNNMIKKGLGVSWISSGCHHSGIVTNSGDLYMCGSALHGKLGLTNVKTKEITKF